MVVKSQKIHYLVKKQVKRKQQWFLFVFLKSDYYAVSDFYPKIVINITSQSETEIKISLFILNFKPSAHKVH